jgi:hypothetical protein
MTLAAWFSRVSPILQSSNRARRRSRLVGLINRPRTMIGEMGKLRHRHRRGRPVGLARRRNRARRRERARLGEDAAIP